MLQQGTNSAPSPSTVVPFFLTSGVSWFTGTLIIFLFPEILFNHFFSPELLSVTHIIVIGFVSFVIFGALYQLIPVIFLTKLFSEHLARFSYWLYLFGTIGLCTSFWFQRFDFPLFISATILTLATLTFVVNLFATILGSTENLVAKLFILTSGFWFFLTVIIGALLSINFSHPFLKTSHLEWLKIHAHFGLIGWMILLIIGVSSVLIPMFLLVHKTNKKMLYFSYGFINAALVLAYTLHSLQMNEYIVFSYLTGTLGLLLYLLFILKVYKTRMRKKLDEGMKKSMISYLLLLIPIILSLLLFVVQVDRNILDIPMSYIFTLLTGFVATLILGQFYKTLPFIIWLKVYKPYVGKEKTPLPKDLYNSVLLKWQKIIHISGFLTMTTALLFHQIFIFKIGALLLYIGACMFLANIIKIISTKYKKL